MARPGGAIHPIAVDIDAHRPPRSVHVFPKNGPSVRSLPLVKECSRFFQFRLVDVRGDPETAS